MDCSPKPLAPTASDVLARLKSDPWADAALHQQNVMPDNAASIVLQPPAMQPTANTPITSSVADSQLPSSDTEHQHASQISVSAFFGKQGLPPPLSALISRNTSSHHWVCGFYKQRDMFDAAESDNRCSGDEGPVLFCYELPGEEYGRRLFGYAHSVAAFWSFLKSRSPDAPHVYEVLHEQQPVHAFFDLEFHFAQNPELSSSDGDAMTARVLSLLRLVLHNEHGINAAGDEGAPAVVLKNYTGGQKYSCHLIAQLHGYAFASTLDVGDLATKIIEYAQATDALRTSDERRWMVDGLLVRKDSSWAPFIDLSVYSKNRCWRVPYASKASKPHCKLAPTKGTLDALHPPDSRPHNPEELDYTVFTHALVTAVGHTSGILIRRSASNSSSPGCLRTAERRERSLSTQLATASAGRCTVFPKSVALVKAFAAKQKRCDEASLQVKSCLTVTDEDEQVQALIVSLAGTRFCARIMREHKSNNVYFVVHFKHQQLYAKCHDPECAAFSSGAVQLPPEVLQEQMNQHPEGIESAAFLDEINRLEQQALQYNNSTSQ